MTAINIGKVCRNRWNNLYAVIASQFITVRIVGCVQAYPRARARVLCVCVYHGMQQRHSGEPIGQTGRKREKDRKKEKKRESKRRREKEITGSITPNKGHGKKRETQMNVSRIYKYIYGVMGGCCYLSPTHTNSVHISIQNEVVCSNYRFAHFRWL